MDFNKLKIEDRANLDQKEKNEIRRKALVEKESDINEYYKKARKQITDRNCMALVDIDTMSVTVWDDNNNSFPVFKKTGIKTKEELDKTIEYIIKEYRQCQIHKRMSQEQASFGTEATQKQV